MNGSIRTEKVAQTIRETLMNVLLRDISDPRLSEVMVTDVKVTKDLHLARVYYDTRDGASLEPKKQIEIEKGLKSAVPFFRRKIGEAMATKFTPELRFEKDTHNGEVAHLMSLIEQVSQSHGSPSAEE
ncbi:30S ribosome-binding factor RbfA [bacterium]|nr:30S ribosome-binding factor RbfA [bacterium]